MAHALSSRQRLVAFLDGGNERTKDEIIAHLNVGERQVRRLLTELRDDGVAIEERRDGPRKRFTLSPEHRTVDGAASLHLSEQEVLALVVAAEASRAVLRPTPLGDPLESAFGKLLSNYQGDVLSFDADAEREHWHIGAGATASIDPAIFKTLQSAVRDQRRVLIDYTTASTGKHHVERPIEPYALAVRGGSWLVVARCVRRNEVRDFSLAGIERAVLTDSDTDHAAIFTVPASFDLDEYFHQRFNVLAGGALRTTRLLVEPDRAIFFRRKRYHTSQHIEEERPDGRIVVSFTTSSLDEMRSFAAGWSSGVTVLEPAELVERMRVEVGELGRRYDPPAADVQPDSH